MLAANICLSLRAPKPRKMGNEEIKILNRSRPYIKSNGASDIITRILGKPQFLEMLIFMKGRTNMKVLTYCQGFHHFSFPFLNFSCIFYLDISDGWISSFVFQNFKFVSYLPTITLHYSLFLMTRLAADSYIDYSLQIRNSLVASSPVA